MGELISNLPLISMGVHVAAFFIAFWSSTAVIRWFIVPRIPVSKDGAVTANDRWAGFWIGFCETLIIFLLAAVGEYGALAIILGAKEFVRKQKIEAMASYYLLGTLVNLAIALLMVRLAQVVSAAL